MPLKSRAITLRLNQDKELPQAFTEWGKDLTSKMEVTWVVTMGTAQRRGFIKPDGSLAPQTKGTYGVVRVEQAGRGKARVRFVRA